MQPRSDLAELDEKLAAKHMRGQWKSESFLSAAIGGSHPAGVPALWPWRTVIDLLDESERAMPESLGARRSLIFHNPGLPRGTSHTINMGVQMIVPGEDAWSHRHSISALRFVIEGDAGLTTRVDGQQCVMETGDLILTPNWTWHDHHNHGNRRTFWLDVLDVPLVLALNQTVFEPTTSAEQPPVAPEKHRQALRYPWSEAEQRLFASTLSADLGQVYEYRNPAGGPTMATLMCSLIRLPGGFSGRIRRNSSSSVYFVIRGAGIAEVGDTRLEWSERDSFVIPNWSPHRLFNRSVSEDTVLFCVSDRPILEALSLYREDM